ncbi:MAG: DUF2029 domain-containing protein [Actinomycetota bacterium]|nr:DUF2029 domain-containing protein [Actinomycetota bacterium]
MPSIAPRVRVAALAVALVLCGLIAYGSPMGVDYMAPPCSPYVCDDAGPALEALSRGDVDGFFAEQPPMGSFSLLVRAPFAAAGEALGLELLGIYRLGAFACVLALALLALWLGFTMYRRGREPLVAVLVPAAIVASPVTYAALEYGHPEELLGAALAVGAVIAAGRDRPVAAGLLLAFAVATKQWALMAGLPVLLAAPGRRVRIVAVSAAAVALLTVPMMLANWDRFWLAQESVGIATTFKDTVTASNVWFPFADGVTDRTSTENGVEIVTQYSLDESIGHLTHPLVALLALLATAAYFLRRRGAPPEEVLQLVALIFLVRCVFDPLTYSYHHAPFLVALIAYEALRRRVPVMSGLAIAMLLFMTHVIAPLKDATLVNVVYLSWSLPLMLVLAVRVTRRSPVATTSRT